MFDKLKQWIGGGKKGGKASPGSSARASTAAEGLPPTLKAKYFDLLGVPPEADLKSIRSAWKRQLKQCHAALLSEDYETRKQATERSRQLNEAYRALADELF